MLIFVFRALACEPRGHFKANIKSEMFHAMHVIGFDTEYILAEGSFGALASHRSPVPCLAAEIKGH